MHIKTVFGWLTLTTYIQLAELAGAGSKNSFNCSFLLNWILMFLLTRMNKLQLTGALLAHSLLFVALIIGCVYQSWKCIALYRLKETSVKMIVIDAKAMRFPAVSVNSGFRREILGNYTY